MLANGITLGYKTTETSYTIATGLKEVPEMGNEPEKVENTTLADSVKHYEFGIGDPGDMEYKFKYENSSATSPYRVFREFEKDKTVVSFEETYPDGTKFHFDAMVSVKLSSGAVNGAVEFTLKTALQSDIEVVDPS
ncbi:phage tail protein [Falcatimonas sp. MSJ-15]|uniref:phage tail protein n=1 Tax=Falcatimonas sp. MSJ-15 TaxID=2841515 RepID=UPI001C1022B0|nr:phage tail protein [Falcatimonas sp. MSJ-15]MBU5469127.1 phage tail protein [Falcatimonas sp. MSJ-15]